MAAARKTVRSRELGRRLKRLRDARKLTQDAVADALNQRHPQDPITQTHLSRVEGGTARLTAEQLGVLIVVLSADDRAGDRLRDLWAHADEPGWLQEYSHLITEPHEMAIALGEDAESIRTYDAVFVQGLLQTEDYARVVIESSRAFVRPIDVDPLVALRLRRQDRLDQPGFGGLTVVLTEAVLRHGVGGSAVMGAQLAKLSEVIEEAKHAVHVLPNERGPWPGTSPFVLYTFADEDAVPVAYVDGDLGSEIHEDPRALAGLTFTFNAAHARALSARESLDRIHAIRKEMWQ